MGFKPEHSVKTLIVAAEDGRVVALCLRGDHEINDAKAAKLPELRRIPSGIVRDAEKVRAAVGCDPGFIGPVSLKNCR